MLLDCGLALKDVLDSSNLGIAYGGLTLLSSLFDLDGALDRIANFESNAVLLQPFIAIASLIKPLIFVKEENIPYAQMLFDFGQLLVGEIYIGQL